MNTVPDSQELSPAFAQDQRFSTTRRLHRIAPPRAPGTATETTLVERGGGLRSLGFGKRSASGLPLISVATVVLNGGTALRQSIESVLVQRYENLEYVVIDGGSTDATLDVLREHEHAIDLWVSSPDRGIYDAMNRARGLVTGDWLIFLGADDTLDPALSVVLAQLTDRRAVYYGDVRLQSSGQRSGGSFSKYRLMQENICHQAILYPKEVYRTKAYDLDFKYLADHKYNIELLGSGIRFVHVGAVFANYNDNGQSSEGDSNFDAQRLQLVRREFGFLLYAVKFIRTVLAIWYKRRFRGSS